jgi:PAS domain S-box-containing protein
MQKSTAKQPSFSFLQGGGEMGMLIRSKDWSATTIGNPETWPQSLRTTLSIILNSKFPMFLFWGPDLICFYNDAYRPSLGREGKHPDILGGRGEDYWQEIWPVIKPLIDQVLDGGEATWSEDQLIPIYRNGKIEDVYWTFSYSPVNDESGKPAGVFVTCNETTEKVNTFKRIEESEERFRTMAESTDVLIAVGDESSNATYFNKAWVDLTGRPMEDLLKFGWADLVHPDDRERYLNIYLSAFEKREPFTGELRVLNKHGHYSWLLAKGPARFRSDGSFAGYISSCIDITEQVKALKKVEGNEQDLRNMVLQAPIGICILDASSLVSEIVNDSFIEVAGKTYEEIAGKFYWDTFAEARPYYEAALRKVVDEGISYYANEVELMLIRHGKEENIYVTFVYAPLKNAEGKVNKVAVWVLENTPQVKARQKIEEADKRFRNTVRQVPIGITILRGTQYIVEMANDAYLELVDRKEAEFVGRPLFDSLPEVKETVHPLLDEVLKTGIPFHGIEYPIPVNRYGKYEVSYFNFLYHPLKEDDGRISGIVVTVTDVSETVKAKHLLAESEKQFRNLVMQSPIPMAIFRSQDYNIEMANTVMFENIWRKKEKEILGKKILDVFPELIDQKYSELLNKVYSAGKVHREIESLAYVQGDDGLRKFYLDFEYNPLFETDGSVSGIMVTVNDVTEKVEARMKIEESEQKFRLLADSMPQHVWTSDTEGNLNYFNQSVFNFSGLTPDQIIKDGWIQIVHPDDRDENIRTWMNAIATGKDFLLEHRFLKHDGQYYWQLSRALPVRDRQGSIQMWVGTSTDINEIKKHQQEKDDFIKIASHELKTPVTTIKAYVQLLLSQGFTQQDQLLIKSLSTIDKQITKLAKLITDLLDVTKIEMGSFHTDKETFSITELIREIGDSIQATAHSHRIIFDQSTDIFVTADKDRITQVLANLLTNAIKYSPNGDKIIIGINTNPGEIVVSIQDFGIGMANKDHERIFERFYRAEGTDSKTFPGFGIGLFIVKEIISRHKGKVWVKSEKNSGSTFYFSLPA